MDFYIHKKKMLKNVKKKTKTFFFCLGDERNDFS